MSLDPLRYGNHRTNGSIDERRRVRVPAPALQGAGRRRLEADGNAAVGVDGIAGAGEAPADARFAVAVAAFGQRLRGGDYIGAFGYDQIAEVARSSRGSDGDGYRAEFIDLVEMAKALDSGS